MKVLRRNKNGECHEKHWKFSKYITNVFYVFYFFLFFFLILIHNHIQILFSDIFLLIRNSTVNNLNSISFFIDIS